MKVSEAFLVNTNNFDTIIKALVNYEGDEPIIDSDLMEELGYSDPNDLLVVRLLKDLNIINNEGEAAKHYHEFRDPETTKKALGKGIVAAYEDLFREHPHIHKSQDDIKQTFEEIFRDKKTDLIIKYISGTFKKLISFVGLNTIDDLLPNDGFAPKKPEESVEEEKEVDANETLTETVEADNTVEHIDEGADNTEYTPPSLNGNHETEEVQQNDSNAEKEPAPTIAEAFENGHVDNGDDGTDNSVAEIENDVAEAVEEETQTAAEKEADTEFSEQSPSEDVSAPSNTAEPMEELSKGTDANLNADDDPVQKALLRKFDLVYKMQRWEDLLQTADRIISRYDDEGQQEPKEKIVQAITRRAEALLELDRPDDALEPINNIIDRFSDSDNKHYYKRASQALMLKAQILEDQEDGDLLELYDTIVNRFESDEELADNEKLDKIILKRFSIVLEEKNDDEVLEACTSLIDRFKGDEAQKDHLHKAMIKRAEILDEMDRNEEALEAYNEFLSAFGS